MEQRNQQASDVVALSGNLSQIALSDVIQIVANDQRAGVVRIASVHAVGAIWFEAGHIVRAELGGRSGAEAFYAAVALEDGQFRLAFNVACERPNVDAGCFPLLMEAARRVDECNRIRVELQSDDYDLVKTPASCSVRSEDLAIAFLFGAPCPVDLALSRCAIGDLEVLTTIARLVEAGALERVARISLTQTIVLDAGVAA